jgi:mannose-6-phosphate isomerase-like protein (cupin superfamily)
MLTAVLEFLPGKQLQPPHQHAEEEFQYVIEGSGTWTLNGIESPITKGDMMYAKPWDIHGISNTSGDTLKFFVVKWLNKGVAEPLNKNK